MKLEIVQVKLRFHGGTRGKERVKELVSQVTERVLLVLCFKLCLYVSDWCEHHDVFKIVKLPVFFCLCFIERVIISTLIGTSLLGTSVEGLCPLSC